jgi:hypothetical protein
VSIEDLAKEAETATNADVKRLRQRIEEEFAASKTNDEHAQVLAIFKAMTDRVERGLAARAGHELTDFRAANAYEYKALIVQECLVGSDLPGGGDVSVELLKAVTDREIAAGRMTEDHSLRQLALTTFAAPHLTHAQLLESHAKLKDESGRWKAAPGPQTPASKAERAYALGTVLGKKLKGLLRK